MKKIFLIVVMLLGVGVVLNAQETQDTTKNEPKGKAIIQVFANAHTGFGADNDDRGFELDRSYLGYQYSFGKGLQMKAVMDIQLMKEYI